MNTNTEEKKSDATVIHTSNLDPPEIVFELDANQQNDDNEKPLDDIDELLEFSALSQASSASSLDSARHGIANGSSTNINKDGSMTNGTNSTRISANEDNGSSCKRTVRHYTRYV